MKEKKQREMWKKALVLVFWLAVWQGAAYLIHNHILLAGPVEVVRRLIAELGKRSFYAAVFGTLGRILTGFFLGLTAGILFGSISYRFKTVALFLEPVVAAMKSIPVAAFVVLVLIWVGSDRLAVPIAFLVVFPYLYISTRTGLLGTDRKLLQMAESFDMRLWNKILHIYRPAVMPSVTGAVKVTVGMAFKSGIAAEVIGIPNFSIGERLYLSKIYLDTEGVLAWTVVVVVCSFLCEKGILFLVQRCAKARIAVPCGSRKQHAAGGGILRLAPMERKYTDSNSIKTPALTVEPGSRTGIMGESGCGKTTWMELILEQGTCAASTVFQEDRLCEDYSAVDNVRMVCARKYADEVRQALTELLPKEAIDRPVSTLSGGMRRRVAVARACLAGGELLLLDEPFTGLDEENRKKTAAFILEHQDDRKILFTTHRAGDMELFGANCVQFAKKN